MLIPLDKVLPNPDQPRKEFDRLALSDLADSIRELGVIEPIVVEEAPGGMFILHDGERRVRAARTAGLAEIPASISPPMNGSGPELRLLRAMAANLQRADLNPIEEALGYDRLHIGLDMPLIEIARKLGVSSARVSQRLELLTLEKPIQKVIAQGRLSKDIQVIKALKRIPSSAARVKLAAALAERGASIKASVEACARLAGSLAAEKIEAGAVPSIRLAVKQAGPVNRPAWDAFAQVGRLPPWLLVEISARNVCDRCGLREQASATICRGCALVEMLAEMIGRAK